MAHKVGTKGQIVIEKEIRERLGIQPGWLAVQTLVGGRVELRFLPPEHRRSLRGVLARHIQASAPADEDLRRARDQAWEAAAAEKGA